MRYKVHNYYDIQIISHIHTQEKKYPVCSTLEVSHVLFPPILIWHKIKTDYDKNIFLCLFYRSFITLFIRRICFHCGDGNIDLTMQWWKFLIHMFGVMNPNNCVNTFQK